MMRVKGTLASPSIPQQDVGSGATRATSTPFASPVTAPVFTVVDEFFLG
jgi:hypothetical protein